MLSYIYLPELGEAADSLIERHQTHGRLVMAYMEAVSELPEEENDENPEGFDYEEIMRAYETTTESIAEFKQEISNTLNEKGLTRR